MSEFVTARNRRKVNFHTSPEDKALFHIQQNDGEAPGFIQKDAKESEKGFGVVRMTIEEQVDMDRYKILSHAVFELDKRLSVLEQQIFEDLQRYQNMNREFEKMAKSYNNNMAQIETALKSSWSYRIRNFLGF